METLENYWTIFTKAKHAYGVTQMFLTLGVFQRELRSHVHRRPGRRMWQLY